MINYTSDLCTVVIIHSDQKGKNINKKKKIRPTSNRTTVINKIYFLCIKNQYVDKTKKDKLFSEWISNFDLINLLQREREREREREIYRVLA